MYHAIPSLPTIRQADAITIPMEVIERAYHVTHMSSAKSAPLTHEEIEAGAITLIDADALQAAADAVFDYLQRQPVKMIDGDPRNDYARQLPVLSEASYTDCPECEGTGVFLIGTVAPDDLIEMRCELCLGTGIIDVADAPTQDLTAMIQAAARLNWPSMPTWDSVVTP